MYTRIKLYADGACPGNPGVGGCASKIVHINGVVKVTKSYRLTSGNRMELMAIVIGLMKVVKKCDITIITDSAYAVNLINHILHSKIDEEVVHLDIAMILEQLLRKHIVRVSHIKRDTDQNQIECDHMARLAAKNKESYLTDYVYEAWLKDKRNDGICKRYVRQ